jgi:hypothetical protein
MKKETGDFLVGGKIEDGENGNGKTTKKKVDGQRTGKEAPRREDTKGRAQPKMITKTAKVRVYIYSYEEEKYN